MLRATNQAGTSRKPAVTLKDDAGEPGEARTRDGRFSSPFSGNPKGRPPKTREDPGALLQRLLEEAAPQASGGSEPPLSVGELLLRRTIVNAMADPRLGLALVKLMLGAGAQASPIAAKDDPEEIDRREAILESFVTRRMRQRSLEATEANGAEEEEL